jgi:hypothetical protein
MWRIHYVLGIGVSALLIGYLAAFVLIERGINGSNGRIAAAIACEAVGSLGAAMVFVALVGYGVCLGTRAASDASRNQTA